MSGSGFQVSGGSGYNELPTTSITGGTNYGNSFNLASYNDLVELETIDFDDISGTSTFSDIEGFDDLISDLAELLEKKDYLIEQYSSATDSNHMSALLKEITSVNEKMNAIVEKMNIAQKQYSSSSRVDEIEKELVDLNKSLDYYQQQIDSNSNDTAKTEMTKKKDEVVKSINKLKTELEKMKGFNQIFKSMKTYDKDMLELSKSRRSIINQIENAPNGIVKTELQKELSRIDGEIEKLSFQKQKYNLLQLSESAQYNIAMYGELVDEDTLKTFQLTSEIYEELALSLKPGQSMNDLLEGKLNDYLGLDDEKASVYYYMLKENMVLEMKTVSEEEKETMLEKYNSLFDPETLFYAYYDTNIAIHDELLTEEEGARELRRLEKLSELMGYDIVSHYQATLDYLAEQREIESRRIQAAVAAQKKREEEEKNPLIWLLHAYQNSEIYKNSFKMGVEFRRQDEEAEGNDDLGSLFARKGQQFLDFNLAYFSSLGQTATQTTLGIIKAGEGVLDFASYAVSGFVEAVLCPIDGFTGNVGHPNSLTLQYADQVNSFISTDWTSQLENILYKTTPFKTMDKNSMFSHESTESQLIKGFGEAFFNIATGKAAFEVVGVSAKTAMMVTAGMKGFGIGTEKALQSGADIQTAGVYGLASGEWEMLQWYIGGQVNEFASAGFASAGASTSKVLGTLALSTMLDSADAGVEGFVQPLLQMIYDHRSYEEIFEDNGGWENVYHQAIIGGVLSLASSSPEALASLKNIKTINEACILNKIERTLKNSKVKIIDFVTDKIPTPLKKYTKGTLELLVGGAGFINYKDLNIGIPAEGVVLLTAGLAAKGLVAPYVMMNNYINDSIFMLMKNKNKYFGRVERISQGFNLKKIAELCLVDNKKAAFSIEVMNLFSQLDKTRKNIDITYSMSSHDTTKGFLGGLQKAGFITDFEAIPTKMKQQRIENLMFGNYKEMTNKKQLYEMKFKLTDKKFSGDIDECILQSKMELEIEKQLLEEKKLSGNLADIELQEKKVFRLTEELKSTESLKRTLKFMGVDKYIKNGNYEAKIVRRGGRDIKVYVPNVTTILANDTGALWKKFVGTLSSLNSKE